MRREIKKKRREKKELLKKANLKTSLEVIEKKQNTKRRENRNVSTEVAPRHGFRRQAGTFATQAAIFFLFLVDGGGVHTEHMHTAIMAS